MPAIFRRPAVWWFACALWAGLLFWLSSRPALHPPVAVRIPHADKIAHFSYFFIGGIFLSLALHSLKPRFPGKLILTVLAAAAIAGAIDEFHQSFVPNRSGNDPGDWLADVLGATTAAAILGKTILHPSRGRNCRKPENRARPGHRPAI
jgi:VanZ family protein